MGKKLVVLMGLVAIGSMFTTPALTHDRSHGYYGSDTPYPGSDRPYPAACEAVFFPRNPRCAGRPAYRDIWWAWHTPLFYNWIWYY
jgi:hypothetical protein